MKKAIGIALIIFFCSYALLFAGGARQRQDAGTTIRFSWWGGDVRHQATLAAIDRFEQLNPDVTIEAEYQGFDGAITRDWQHRSPEEWLRTLSRLHRLRLWNLPQEMIFFLISCSRT